MNRPQGPPAAALICIALLSLIAASPPRPLPAGPGALGPTEVVVHLAGSGGQAPAAVRLRFSAKGSSSSGEARPLIERRIEAPGETTVDLADARIWRFEVSAPGYWSPDLVVTPTAGDQPLSVVLYPTGKLRGRVEVPAGEELPAALEVSFKPPPKEDPGTTVSASGAAPPGLVTCPVSEARWECEVPAGRFDLRLRAGGFVPVYLWGAEVPRDEARELGPLRLLPGASVSGWVEAQSDGRAIAGCEVRLFVATSAPPTDRATRDRLRTLDTVTRTNERGFFQLQGIPAGSYGLILRHDGYAETSLAPIEVQEGLESQVLEPIQLGEPVALQATVFPALDPYGRPWRLDLFREAGKAGRFAESFHGSAGADGTWSRKGLPPGAYRLEVADDDGSRWADREVRLDGDRVEELIEIDLVEVWGEVTLGDDPVAAEIWFGGEDGARRVKFAAGLNGRFEGFLPEEGRWPVEVLLQPEEERRLAIEPVEVRRREGKGYAEVAIHIADTLLQGEVVDEGGGPVPSAAVEILGAGPGRGRSSTETDDEGRFEVRGVPEGKVVVYAETEDAISDWTPVQLEEGEAPPDLRLVLRRQKKVAGEVVSERGPVPGARVLALPDVATSAGASVAQAVSGPTGGFQLTLPAAATAATLIVVAPRSAVRILRLMTGSPEPWKIPVEAAGGTLLVPAPEASEYGSRRTGLLFHAGAGVPEALVLRLLPGDSRPDGTLALSNLEPGDYALCPPGSGTAALRNSAVPGSEARCASGLLLPAGELRLIQTDGDEGGRPAGGS